MAFGFHMPMKTYKAKTMFAFNVFGGFCCFLVFLGFSFFFWFCFIFKYVKTLFIIVEARLFVIDWIALDPLPT